MHRDFQTRVSRSTRRAQPSVRDVRARSKTWAAVLQADGRLSRTGREESPRPGLARRFPRRGSVDGERSRHGDVVWGGVVLVQLDDVATWLHLWRSGRIDISLRLGQRGDREIDVHGLGLARGE